MSFERFKSIIVDDKEVEAMYRDIIRDVKKRNKASINAPQTKSQKTGKRTINKKGEIIYT